MRKLLFVLLANSLMFQLHAQNLQQKTDTSIAEPTSVQVEARFPGGTKAWAKYLENNLNTSVATKYIKLKKGEQVASETAIVSFLVDKEGNISEVTILNPAEVHPKIAAEAIRVIKEGPKWTPAIQNGKNVYYRQKQNITFQVSRD